MTFRSTRREFLQDAATLGTLAGGGQLFSLARLTSPATGDEAASASVVPLPQDIEPLVRLIEDSPRESLLEEVAEKVRAGLQYEQLLAALLLAGVRNVEPRPSVGFKFHAVLVAQSVHLASVASPPADRWLPLFWSLDNFKGAQAQDDRERGWTMAAVDEGRLPTADSAKPTLVEGLERWDEAKTDAAVAGLVRNAQPKDIWEIFFRYGAHDFRSIGHKAINVANCHRVLNVIGWRYAEPVLRSLAYSLLMHEDGNPADRDDPADRPWRDNQALAQKFPAGWHHGKPAIAATRELLASFRNGSEQDAARQVADLAASGVGATALWDAMFLAAVELLVRQPGIVALHAVTTTNALHYAYRCSEDEQTRRMLLLQNASFLPLFRGAMQQRGAVDDFALDQLQPVGTGTATDAAVEEIFEDVNREPMRAAGKTLEYLQRDAPLDTWSHRALQLIVAKGTDAHDYKFGCAVLEDALQISPDWRSRYLAAAVFRLQGATRNDNPLILRARAELSG